MAAKKKTEEVYEVEIITDEQLQVFDEDTQETIIFLTDNIAPNQLMVLNPFVQKLIEIRKLKDLKYDDSTDEAKKKSIANFKEAKTSVAEFKKFVTETKSALKKPIDKVGKEILVIEKFGLSEVVNVLTAMEETFSDYLAEEQKKKDIAAKKKLDKANEAINEVKKMAEESASVIAINEVKTKIQYTFLDEIEVQVATALESWGIDALKMFRVKLAKTSLLDYVESNSLNTDLLEEDVFDFLIDNFNTKLAAKVTVVDNKIELLESQKSHEIRDIKEEVKAEMQKTPEEPRTGDGLLRDQNLAEWGKSVPSSSYSDSAEEQDEGDIVTLKTHGIELVYNSVVANVSKTAKSIWELIDEMNESEIDLNIPKEEQDPKVSAILDAGNLMSKVMQHISNK